MTYTINRIPLTPVIKISFIIYFIMAFIGVLLYSTILMSVLGTIGGLMGGMDFPVRPPGGGSLIFIGIFGAIMLAVLYTLIEGIRCIALALQSFIPDSADKLLFQLAVAAEHRGNMCFSKEYALKPATLLPKPEPVFPRFELADDDAA